MHQNAPTIEIQDALQTQEQKRNAIYVSSKILTNIVAHYKSSIGIGSRCVAIHTWRHDKRSDGPWRRKNLRVFLSKLCSLYIYMRRWISIYDIQMKFVWLWWVQNGAFVHHFKPYWANFNGQVASIYPQPQAPQIISTGKYELPGRKSSKCSENCRSTLMLLWRSRRRIKSGHKMFPAQITSMFSYPLLLDIPVNLKISNHTRMQGTQGVDKEIFIKITVNLDESDVNVTGKLKVTYQDVNSKGHKTKGRCGAIVGYNGSGCKSKSIISCATLICRTRPRLDIGRCIK